MVGNKSCINTQNSIKSTANRCKWDIKCINIKFLGRQNNDGDEDDSDGKRKYYDQTSISVYPCSWRELMLIEEARGQGKVESANTGKQKCGDKMVQKRNTKRINTYICWTKHKLRTILRIGGTLHKRTLNVAGKSHPFSNFCTSPT